MFDIGFWEICLIGVIALLVVGPEKLPKVARTAGMWVGRAQRMVSSIKQDIDKELRLQELQESLLKNERDEIHQFVEETKGSVSEINQTVRSSTTLPPNETSSNSTEDKPSTPPPSSTEISFK